MTNFAMTAGALALLAAGAPLLTKDAGDGPIEALTKAFEAHNAAVEGKLGENEKTLAELRAQVFEIEQKAARGIAFGGRSGALETPGSIVAQHDNFDAARHKGGRVRIEVKAITSGDGSAGSMVQPDRDPTVVTLPRRRLRVRQLLGRGETNKNAVEYVRQTGFTNNADMVAEGTRKPESDITFELLDTKVRTMAHFVKASRQILDDVPMLRTTIDSELRYGLAFKEEQQLLNGNGAGQNLLGIIPQATAYETTRDEVGDTRFDTILHAMEQAEVAELPASSIILNTADWHRMLGIKDGDGNYISGGPLANVPERIWRLPVVWTNAMAAGTFLVGALDTATMIYDRMQPAVEIATENEDDFVRNLVTILAEERLAMAVKRPEAIVYGSFPV